MAPRNSFIRRTLDNTPQDCDTWQLPGIYSINYAYMLNKRYPDFIFRAVAYTGDGYRLDYPNMPARPAFIYYRRKNIFGE